MINGRIKWTLPFSFRRDPIRALLFLSFCIMWSMTIAACTIVHEIPKTGEPAETKIRVLKRDLFFAENVLIRSRKPEILPPWAEPGYARETRVGDWDAKNRRTIWLLPSSVAEYRRDPTQWPHIIGVVPAGTKFVLSRVTFEQQLEWNGWWYYGKFLDGPYAGRTVLLNDIWGLNLDRYVESEGPN